MKKPAGLFIDSKEIYETLFNKAIEGLLVIDKQGRIRVANPRAEEIFLYTNGELTDKWLEEIVPSRLHTECRQLRVDFMARAAHSRGEEHTLIGKKKDGTEFPAEVSLSNHVHSSEGPMMVALVSDISERKKNERILKEEKNLLENLLQSMGDAFVSFDKEWKYTYVNDKALHLMRKTKEELLGKCLWDVFPDVVGSEFDIEYHKVMDERKAASFEAYHPLNDRWVEVRSFPTESGIAVFFTDITPRKNTEEKLKQSEERFSKAFHSSPAALSISTLAEGRFIDVNESFLELFRYSREELIGKISAEIGIFKYTSPAERIAVLSTLKKKGQIRNHETIAYTKEGKPVIIYFSSEAIVLNGQDYMLGTMIDISEKKKSEETILKLNELLEKKVRDRTLELTEALERERQANELKSRFVTMASHEFRTPLAAILSSLHLIEQYSKPEQEEKRKKHIDRVKSSVNNLTEILTDFLSMEKLEQGKMEPISRTFNLKEKIYNVIGEIEGLLKKGQKINYVHNGEEEVYQDKKILYNIILNLLSNASKYSNEDGRIDLDSKVENGEVMITIKDYGIGIPQEEQQYMFTRFFRAKNAETIQGTGMGLSIVKKYMELLGGDIYFTSKENEGSVFTIRFASKNK